MAAAPAEQRLAEALRLQATGGAGRPVGGGHRSEVAPPPSGMRLPTALAIAFLLGVLLGTTLALISVLLPGVLPGTA
jgi:hypothetical protein